MRHLTVCLLLLAFFCKRAPAAATACESGNHMSMISSYWTQSGPALGNYWPDIQWTFQAGHVVPNGNDFSFLANGTANAIIELYWTLFDSNGNGCDPSPTQSQDLAAMNASLAPYIAAGKITAFYIHDEPYGNGCTITQIENAIAVTKAMFPGIPCYITFAQLCFDPNYGNCKTPGSQRGIPSNLDWMGFDWYLESTISTFDAYQNFLQQIVSGVHTLIGLMTPQQKVFLCADGFTINNQEPMLVQIAEMFWNFSQITEEVIGIDFFLYPSIPPNQGLDELPTLRASVSGLGRLATHQCNNTADLLPIYWYASSASQSGSASSSSSSGHGHHHHSSSTNTLHIPSRKGAAMTGRPIDNMYTAFAWDGWDPTGEYTPMGARFGLAPLNKEGTAILYSCWLATGTHWLTFSAECDNKDLKVGENAVALGAAWTSTSTGVVPLNRFVASKNAAMWIYDVTTTPPTGYMLETTIGYAYPQAAI